MISFEVDDMSCGHCVATITAALKAVDPNAQVRIDLATHRVDIEPSAGGAVPDRYAQAIADAGYEPTAVRSPAR